MSLRPESRRLVQVIHAAAAAKLAREPVALDVVGLAGFTDALYVCHGESTRAVEAIVESILEGVRASGEPRPRVEGMGSLQWVLLDFGDVMAHVFLKERRSYYNLERLWHDAPQVALEAA